MNPENAPGVSKKIRAISRGRKIGLAIVLVVSCFITYKWYQWWTGPDRLARLTASAFERGDYKTLVDLCWKEETDKLGLSESSVAGFISETAWPKFHPKVKSFEKLDQPPPDQIVYIVHLDRKCPLNNATSFTVTFIPHVGWRLMLSDALVGAANLTVTTYDINDRVEFALGLMRKYHIKGTRSNTPGYSNERKSHVSQQE